MEEENLTYRKCCTTPFRRTLCGSKNNLRRNKSWSKPPGHLVKIRRIKRYDISVLDESPSEQLRRESKRLLETAGKVIEHAAILTAQAADLKKQVARLERNIRRLCFSRQFHDSTPKTKTGVSAGSFTRSMNSTSQSRDMDAIANRRITSAVNCIMRENVAGVSGIGGGRLGQTETGNSSRSNYVAPRQLTDYPRQLSLG
jgi:hypothetical protein